MNRIDMGWGLAATAAVFLSASSAQSMPLDGSSAASAGVSAKQILADGFATGDGLYWIDPDGPGSVAAFQIFGDMTTSGGGWTLGLNSVNGSVSASTDMVANTGTVGTSSGHTRNMTDLAIDRDAQIRHQLWDNNGSILFDGYYTGSYHGTLASAAAWTVISGSFSNTRLDYHLGRDWSTSTNDVDDYGGNCATAYGMPWYFGRCWTTIPVQTLGGSYPTNAPVDSLNGYQAIGRYAIYARELVTPEFAAADGQAPVPATPALILIGLLGLGYSRRNNDRAGAR